MAKAPESVRPHRPEVGEGDGSRLQRRLEATLAPFKVSYSWRLPSTDYYASALASESLSGGYDCVWLRPSVGLSVSVSAIMSGVARVSLSRLIGISLARSLTHSLTRSFFDSLLHAVHV